jgi:competence protein ComFC
MYQALIKPLFKDVKTFVLDTLFPISCLSCGMEGTFICVDCKMLLKTLEHQRCIVCQKPTPFGLTHTGCQTPHGADGLISFYDYHDDKMAKIIIAGKYSFIPAAYEVLAAMIAQKIKQQFPNLLTSNFFLTPIPLNNSRKRWRGFNQAEVLCQELSKQLILPCISVLVRGKSTKTQKDLKKEQRQKNMQDAFILAKNAAIRGKNIILVDDVTTTGATLQEAAKILKRNGAKKVICLTIARD